MHIDRNTVSIFVYEDIDWPFTEHMHALISFLNGTIAHLYKTY